MEDQNKLIEKLVTLEKNYKLLIQERDKMKMRMIRILARKGKSELT